MTQTATKSLLELFGTTEAPASRRVFKAGPLAVEFCGGALGAIHHNDIEVLRGISYLVRDENWGTCTASLAPMNIIETGNAFEVTFNAEAMCGGSTFSYFAKIEASPRRLTFTVRATPDRDLRTNRTGFVILHPINGVGGKPVNVTHIDGKKTRSKFPKFISPGQPFFNIRALEHSPAPGLQAQVLMEGGKFEMEDQRNWGDASFKTYVCSLLDPWPYTLKAGETFEQSVTLTIKGEATKAAGSAATTVTANGKRNARLPEIGLNLSEDNAGETLQHLDLLKELSPRFLLCTYEEGRTREKALNDFAAISRQTGIPLRLELILSADKSAIEGVRSAAAAMHLSGILPSAVIVTQVHDLKSFQPTDVRPQGPGFEDMAKAARALFPGVPVGGGMASYFTEFNRKQPPDVFDFLTHSICPIVHDASDAAVMQTLETLPHIFASAKAIIGETPYHLGPTTIAARMNPYGKELSSNTDNRRVCLAPNDPRQFGEFAVTWNLGLLAASAKAGLQSVTLGSLCGPRGLLDARGNPTPLFHLLASLKSASGERIRVEFADWFVSLCAGKTGKLRTWLGNIKDSPRRMDLAGQSAEIDGYCTRRIEFA
jgi:D-apionolactonase